jgi:IS5 family transposase
LEMINAQIKAGGLEIKAGIIVDASIVGSARRARKTQDVTCTDDDGDPQGGGGGYEIKTSYSGDVEAAWTKKGAKYYYGYKAHIAVDAEYGFILSGHATAANRPDCKEMMAVVENCGLEKGAPVFADKGYSGKEYSRALEKKGYFDGIMYKAARNHPLSEPKRLVNRAISRFRGKVERAFGTLKKDHRMARARYLGSAKVGSAAHAGRYGIQPEKGRKAGKDLGWVPQGAHIQTTWQLILGLIGADEHSSTQKMILRSDQNMNKMINITSCRLCSTLITV